jgi:hypothetical protein
MEIKVACIIYKLAHGAILSIFSMLFVVYDTIIFLFFMKSIKFFGGLIYWSHVDHKFEWIGLVYL